MFGTFQREEDEVYYGITTPLASWNPIWANVHYWVELWQTAKKTSGLKDRFNVFMKPPGWYPDSLGGFKPAAPIDVLNYQKFDSQYQTRLVIYILFQFFIALGSGSFLLFFYARMPFYFLVFMTVFTLTALLSCGALLEKKEWLKYFEYFRLVLGIVFLFFFKDLTAFSTLVITLIVIHFISILWFYYLQNFAPHDQKIRRV
ncbi:hypothetical protein D9M68_606350 [compost metagenome]